jgi:hypothetical protein
MVEPAWIEVSDLWLQMGKVPFKWSKLHGLEIDELRRCVDDQDIESVRRTMDHLLAACHFFQPSHSVDQRPAQQGTINLHKRGGKIWTL